MTAKARQTTRFENLTVKGASTSGGGAITAGTGVAVSADGMHLVRRATLTLSGFEIAIAEADDYGGTKLCDLPDSNLMLFGYEVDLELTKGGVTNGLVAATDINVAVGTAVASASTLATTMIDVVSTIAMTDTDLTPAMQIHSNADATLTYPIQLADSATLALYLNLAAAITADDTLTADGTIDLYFIDLGNVTS